jgi:NADH:ubiquinone oxidoreductase subunit 4 (subunit M)
VNYANGEGGIIHAAGKFFIYSKLSSLLMKPTANI